ncbi:MAG: PEP-CTERM sorting domain-containing protein [Planctomycetes bacterium]|nr:PEP-CTERM sorting domain-containing protein [Planctomycetota bacterium]
MKKCLMVLVVLLLVAGSANAALVLHYQMDSADDFNLGENIGGFSGRTYVTNAANGELASGMTSGGGVFFDSAEGALRMESGWTQLIQGMEDGDALFTSSTQYTFSLWAKGDKLLTTGNGYGFYLNFTDGSKFKCDLSWKPDAAAVFSSPGGGWQSSAYHIWDTDPQYADRYVDPETWNMYTFVWDADNQAISTYVNGILRGGPMAAGTAITAGATVAQFGFGSESPYHKLSGWFKDYRVYDNALDAAEVAALVPEPATIALLGFGALALIRKRK